jgi:hypothetical protein
MLKIIYWSFVLAVRSGGESAEPGDLSITGTVSC